MVLPLDLTINIYIYIYIIQTILQHTTNSNSYTCIPYTGIYMHYLGIQVLYHTHIHTVTETLITADEANWAIILDRIQLTIAIIGFLGNTITVWTLVLNGKMFSQGKS